MSGGLESGVVEVWRPRDPEDSRSPGLVEAWGWIQEV